MLAWFYCNNIVVARNYCRCFLCTRNWIWLALLWITAYRNSVNNSTQKMLSSKRRKKERWTSTSTCHVDGRTYSTPLLPNVCIFSFNSRGKFSVEFSYWQDYCTLFALWWYPVKQWHKYIQMKTDRERTNERRWENKTGTKKSSLTESIWIFVQFCHASNESYNCVYGSNLWSCWDSLSRWNSITCVRNNAVQKNLLWIKIFHFRLLFFLLDLDFSLRRSL